MTLKTFAPSASTVQLAANGTTSSNVAVDVNSSVVRVYNGGPDLAYVRFGGVSDAASTGNIPIPVGSPELFTKGSVGYAAAICDSGKSATLFFTAGEGM